MGKAVQAHLQYDVESFFAGRGYASAAQDVLITEILNPQNPTFDQLKADGAISEELGGLLDMKEVKIVLADTFFKYANFLGTRIVLAIEEYQTKEELWKERIVVQGFMDRESRHIVSDAGFVALMPVRLLQILCFSLGYAIWTLDVKQEYLRGGQLTREIDARPPKEMRKRLRGYLLRMPSPIYGLREAGYYWGILYMAMFAGNLSMNSTLVDRYFLYRHPARPRSST